MEVVFPTACKMCGERGVGFICEACTPLTPIRGLLSTPSLREVNAIVPYKSPLGELIRNAKRQGHKAVFQKVGRWMGQSAIRWAHFDAFDAVVPVPSPWDRKLRRGFNPSAVLASEIAKWIRRPLLFPLRIRPGPRQAILSRAERKINVGSRLQAKHSVPPRILLVDDVATTGSTAEACAHLLRHKGSSSIILFVPCITHSK